MKVERYHGQIIKVGTSSVSTTVIGGRWAIDYIAVPSGLMSKGKTVLKYRDILLREHIKIIKVLPGLIVFEQ